MNKSIRESAKTYSVFATGILAGYAASKLFKNGLSDLRHIGDRVPSISFPVIAPVIPDFDKELADIDVGSHLGFDE